MEHETNKKTRKRFLHEKGKFSSIWISCTVNKFGQKHLQMKPISKQLAKGPSVQNEIYSALRNRNIETKERWKRKKKTFLRCRKTQNTNCNDVDE